MIPFKLINEGWPKDISAIPSTKELDAEKLGDKKNGDEGDDDLMVSGMRYLIHDSVFRCAEYTAVTLVDDIHVEATKLRHVVDKVVNVDSWLKSFAHGDQVWMRIRR